MVPLPEPRQLGTPAEEARRVLAQHWDGSLPVDPGAVAKALGVFLEPIGSASDPWGYSGYFKPNDPRVGAPVVQYNQADPLVRRRFTVAHELGHYVLRHGHAPRDKPDMFRASTLNPTEREANQFAAELLMPEGAVRNAVKSGRFGSVSEMAEAFKVSEAAMSYRLTNLRITAW